MIFEFIQPMVSEVQQLLGPGFVLLFLMSAFCWYWFGYRPFQYWKSHGIPQPPVKFFTGNGEDIIKLGIVEAYASWIKQYGKVVGFYIGTDRNILVSDVDLVREITIKHFPNFIDRRIGVDWVSNAARGDQVPPGLLGLDGEYWKQTRNIITPSFSTKKLKQMVPLIDTCCNDLLDEIDKIASSNGSVDFWRLFGKFTMQATLAAAFGRHVRVLKGEADDLTEAARELFAAYSDLAFIQRLLVFGSHFPFLTWLFNPLIRRSKFAKNFSTLAGVSVKLIDTRMSSREQQYTDLLQLLINAHVEDEQGVKGKKSLTNREILGLCIEILLAGYETTSNSLAFTAYLLALNPEKQDKLCHAISEYFTNNKNASVYEASYSIQYLDWVFQESLRRFSPVSWVVRHCVKATTINGIPFPNDCKVILPLQAIHMSPEHWDEPFEFRPERFSPEEKQSRPSHAHIPFGIGPRHCIGMRFAAMEAKMTLVSILRQYKFIRAPETEVPLKTVTGITQAPANGIYLKIERHYMKNN